jgi:hypothetical protein
MRTEMKQETFIRLILPAMLDVIAASKAINAVQDMPAITMEDQFVMPIAKAMT